MKNKALLIITVIFFLLVQSRYYLEDLFTTDRFPFMEMVSVFVLFLVFIILVMSFLFQVEKAFKEKFNNRSRLYLITFMLFALGVTVWRPFGLVDFEKFEGKDVFVANAEGAANCNSILKLKDNKIKGTYSITGDTIKFVGFDRKEHHPKLRFAIVRPTKFLNSKVKSDVLMHFDDNDTAKRPLLVTMNKIIK
jgi:amino acid transporter